MATTGKRTDIESVLILGAGPIVIGQACEFDYSGAQACKALKDEGYRVVLVNSNPATILTDPTMADATYIEPVEWRTVAKIIEAERPDALLPTMGGQTALNCALDLVREGVTSAFGVELIGASQDAIDKAEDRERFIQAMDRIGLATPRSAIAHSLEEALQVQSRIGFPCIIRPSFTLGGSGGASAYNRDEFIEICRRGLDLSPTNELLIDESLLGWKEFEMEVIPGQARQLHHRLLHREPRSHGDPYRRLHHGGAGADLDRQGVPTPPQRLHCRPSGDRRGDRRIQRPSSPSIPRRAAWS